MKKLFLVLAAAFAMVACQTDINEVGVAGGEVDVTFEVGTPTRAYSDGTTATRLQYAIYDETGAELTALTKTDATIDITATVELKLVTGNSYTAIFWADNDAAPYTVNFGAKTMTVDYTGETCNNENLDAFYAIHPFTVKGAQTETIELRRPFAQLNIGTSDYTASTNAGYTPTKSAVTVKNVYTTLNLWDGTVDDATVVNFATAPIAKTETFPVAGYEYLAMNYLLVDSDKEVVDVEFAYTESDDTAAKTRIVGSVPVQRNYRTNIYGQLLTSDVDIVVEIKPEYEGEHNGGAASGNVTYVENLAELQAALAMPAAEKGPHHYIYFTADIAGDATILQTADLCLVIDGQGYKFDGTFLVNGNARSTGAETLTFQNIAFESATAKTFISSPSKIDGRYSYSHNVTVKDCSFKGNWANGVEVGGVSLTGTYHPAILNCTADNMHSLCQFQSVDNDVRIEDVTITNGKNGISLGNSAKVTIKNAEVHAAEYGIRADGNASRGNLVIEESTIEAKQPIVVRKVTTSGYSVKVDDATVLTTTEPYHIVFTKGSDDVAYVAPVVEFACDAPAQYVVFPDFSSATVVASVAELNAALADASVDAIVLTAGVNYGTIVMKSNKTIFGVEGAVVECVNLYGAKNVTIKNIVFDAATAKMGYDGKGTAKQYANIITGDNVNKANKGAHNLVIEGCVFQGTFASDGVAIAFTDQHRGGGGSGNVTIKGCTFDTVNANCDIYGYYTGYGTNGHGEFIILNNVFKKASNVGGNVYLGRYASSTPVKVSGNKFAAASLEDAMYVQDHSSYGVSVDASDNTFGN